MELAQEQRRDRFYKESGHEAMSTSAFAIFGGIALMAAAGLGFGLLVFGVCVFIDGWRTSRKGESGRLMGGRAPYPWQAQGPSSAEYDEFGEDSDLLRFGRFFLKAWFVLWIPTLALLIAILGS